MSQDHEPVTVLDAFAELELFVRSMRKVLAKLRALEPRPAPDEPAGSPTQTMDEFVNGPFVAGALPAPDEPVSGANAPASTSSVEALQPPDSDPAWELRWIKNLDPLTGALQRAESKGYMPDAMAEEWNAFDWRVPVNPPIPASLPESAEPRDELGWLIEREGPQWWDGFDEWTSDASRAIRFCREQDAFRMLLQVYETRPKADRNGLTVTEHLWPETPKGAEQPAPQTESGANALRDVPGMVWEACVYSGLNWEVRQKVVAAFKGLYGSVLATVDTAGPSAEPLTDEQIDALADEILFTDRRWHPTIWEDRDKVRRFARGISAPQPVHAEQPDEPSAVAALREPDGYRWRFKKDRGDKDKSWRYCERDPRGDPWVIDVEPLQVIPTTAPAHPQAKED